MNIMQNEKYKVSVATMNWNLRYAKEAGLKTDLKNIFKDMFKSTLRDPSQCEVCGKDFHDAKHPKQKINLNNLMFSEGPLTMNSVPRSEASDKRCVKCLEAR